MGKSQGRRITSWGMRWCQLLAIMVGCLLSIACVSGKKADTTLLRAAPSHLHWLQRQSMLAQTPDLIAQVSQSGRLWLQTSQPNREKILLQAAPNWLLAQGIASPIFMNARKLIPGFPGMGINGLYLGETGEKPELWHSAKKSLKPASLQFDPEFGTDAQYDVLSAEAERTGVELGSTLIGGATGQGPDFFLQARSAPGYSGLYAMLAVPQENWALLPAAQEWEGVPIPPSTILALAEQGVIPPSLARDSLPWASKGGWAATGEITGADGLQRRWLYRFSQTPAQPVLAWHDPSGLAAQIYSGAVIRATGLLGQSLAGFSLESLMGLEPGKNASLAPGIDALNDLSRQVHRYGGWAMQTDAVPVSAIEAVLAGATDFCRDDVTEALALFGYLAADGRPLAHLYRDWIAKKIPFHRLSRGMNHANAPVLGILKEPPFEPVGDELANVDAMDENLYKFLLVLRAGMPGLAFFSEKSLTPSLHATLRARKTSKLALGEVRSVVRGNGGGFALVTSLPDGGIWVMACNFGKYPDQIRVSLPKGIKKGVNVATGQDIGTFAGENFSLDLDGHTAQNILFKDH